MLEIQGGSLWLHGLSGWWEDGPEVPNTAAQIGFRGLIVTEALKAKAGALERDGKTHLSLCDIEAKA